MDTQKDILAYNGKNSPDFSGRRVVVGAKQLKKALRNGNVCQVYLARNADPAITGPIEVYCKEHRVAYTWVKSMTDLGRACGIEVGAATAAVVDSL